MTIDEEARRRTIQHLIEEGILPKDYYAQQITYQSNIKSDDEARQRRFDRLEAEAEARLQSVNPGAYDAAKTRNSSVSDEQIQKLIDSGDLPANELINRRFDRISDINREYYRKKIYESVFKKSPSLSNRVHSFSSADERRIEEQRQEAVQMQVALERAMKLR